MTIDKPEAPNTSALLIAREVERRLEARVHQAGKRLGEARPARESAAALMSLQILTDEWIEALHLVRVLEDRLVDAGPDFVEPVRNDQTH